MSCYCENDNRSRCDQSDFFRARTHFNGPQPGDEARTFRCRGGPGIRRQEIRLVNRSCTLPVSLVRCNDDLKPSLSQVRLKTIRGSGSLTIGCNGQLVVSAKEGPARAVFGEEKGYSSTGNRLVTFIAHLHHQLLKGPKRNIVVGGFALDYGNSQSCGC